MCRSKICPVCWDGSESALAWVFAIAAQGFLGYFVLWRIMPGVGWGAFDLSEWAAGFFAM